jgi:hypothetical protein
MHDDIIVRVFAVLAMWHEFMIVNRKYKNTWLTYTKSVVKFGLLFHIGMENLSLT